MYLTVFESAKWTNNKHNPRCGFVDARVQKRTQSEWVSVLEQNEVQETSEVEGLCYIRFWLVVERILWQIYNVHEPRRACITRRKYASCLICKRSVLPAQRGTRYVRLMTTTTKWCNMMQTENYIFARAWSSFFFFRLLLLWFKSCILFGSCPNGHHGSWKKKIETRQRARLPKTERKIKHSK